MKTLLIIAALVCVAALAQQQQRIQLMTPEIINQLAAKGMSPRGLSEALDLYKKQLEVQALIDTHNASESRLNALETRISRLENALVFVSGIDLEKAGANTQERLAFIDGTMEVVEKRQRETAAKK